MAIIEKHTQVKLEVTGRKMETNILHIISSLMSK